MLPKQDSGKHLGSLISLKGLKVFVTKAAASNDLEHIRRAYIIGFSAKWKCAGKCPGEFCVEVVLCGYGGVGVVESFKTVLTGLGFNTEMRVAK